MDIPMTVMNKPKEQKIEKWKTEVPFNDLKVGEDYYVQFWTADPTRRVGDGHTYKAIAKNFIGLGGMVGQGGEFVDTTGAVPENVQIALFEDLKPINNKYICDLCEWVDDGFLVSRGRIALSSSIGVGPQELGFKFYPKKALQIKATHVFKSKKKNNSETVYQAFPFEVKEQQDQKPNAPVHEDSTVLSRFKKYGGRKRRTRRRKIKKRKRKTNKRKSRKKRKTRRRKRSK